MDFYFFLLRLIFSFFFLTVPLPWKLYMLVYMDVSYCMYISWQNYQRKRRRKKSTSKLERPTRMSYPTWGALLHMAMSHSCLNHKIDELSLVFSAKSPSQRSSTLTMSEPFHPSIKLQAPFPWLVTPLYVHWRAFLWYHKPTRLVISNHHLFFFSWSANKNFPVWPLNFQ